MENKKLEKLSQLANFLTEEGITKEEFLKSFKKVIDQVLKIETKAIKKINTAIDELKNGNSTSLEATQADLKAVKADLGNNVAKALKEQENGMNFIRDKVRNIIDGKDGKDGKDVDENKIIKEVLNKIKIPKIDESKNDKLREELFEEIRRNKLLGGGGTSYLGIKQHFVDDETPSGTVNGTNTDFTILKAPNPVISLKVFVNGMRMRITEDYTLSGATITFITAPPTGSIILCDYRK